MLNLFSYFLLRKTPPSLSNAVQLVPCFPALIIKSNAKGLMYKLVLFTLLLIPSVSLSQADPFAQLKTQYDRLRKEEKHDSTLVVAKQMNAWALQNETDTSLRYIWKLTFESHNLVN